MKEIKSSITKLRFSHLILLTLDSKYMDPRVLKLKKNLLPAEFHILTNMLRTEQAFSPHWEKWVKLWVGVHGIVCSFWKTERARKVLNYTKGQPKNPMELCPLEKRIMTKWKTAAYALALPATLKTVLWRALVIILVTVHSKLWLFIIFNFECSITTKFKDLLFM